MDTVKIVLLALLIGGCATVSEHQATHLRTDARLNSLEWGRKHHTKWIMTKQDKPITRCDGCNCADFFVPGCVLDKESSDLLRGAADYYGVIKPVKP